MTRRRVEDGPFEVRDLATGETVMVGTRREAQLWLARHPEQDLVYLPTKV